MMVESKRLIKLLAALTVLLLLGYATVMLFDREFHKRFDYLPTGSLTKDSTQVTISIGENHLSIPKNYIFDKGSQKDSGVNYLMLIASLPNLVGYSDQTEIYYEQQGDVPLVRITLLDWKENKFKYDSFINLSSAISKNSKFDPYLKIYLYEYETSKKYGRLKEDYQFVSSDLGGGYQLNCDKEGVVPSPHCSAYIKYSDELLVKYAFNRKFLDEWPDTEIKIIKLIDLFIDKEKY